MIKTNSKILLGVTIAFIVLTIAAFIILKFFSAAEEIPILEDTRERTDIIVSDRVSLGCFIPPDLSKADSVYNGIFDNEDLKEKCLKTGNNKYIDSDMWNEIKNNLQYGIKLNGYCYDCLRKGCLCLDKNMPGWEGIKEADFFKERRSIDFGTNYPSSIGKNLEKQSFVEIRGQPSVIVVNKTKPVKLSIYAGIKLGGKKIVEKVTAALYNKTGRISTVAGEERSCYTGKNWDNCYKTCLDGEALCRMKCDCYTEQRYYDEDPLEICKNYCNSKDFDGSSSDCETGCEEGKKMNCYRDCFVKTGNAHNCELKCSCTNCGTIFKDKKFDLVNYLFCEEESVLTGNDQKHGCEKFLKIENSTFHTKIGNYTIFKVGNIKLDDSTYRGVAWAVANLTTKEPHPGESCYNYNKYSCYHTFWEEVCKRADSTEICWRGDCIGGGPLQDLCKIGKDQRILPWFDRWTYGFIVRKVGEERCNCSTTSRTDAEFDDPFILCKTFCSSRDGYYGNGTKITKCQEGCEWAARRYEEPGFVNFQKNVDLVFVVDTSGSMNDEWRTLCNIMDNIKKGIEEKDYKLNVTLYALGEKSKPIDITPSCDYTILNCSDINLTLGLSINCNNGNCYMESWGPGAEWAVKNHQWRKDVLSKILFVVGDEGPYCGGTCSSPCSDPYDDQNDIDSVKRAADAAIENNVTIFGLWGIGISNNLKDLFKNISESTGGNATKFDTADSDEVTKIITDAITKDIEFETGYNKFVNLTKGENTVTLESPYIWRNVYDEVWSNLIYIVDWNNPGSEWNYPLNGNDWTKVHTPILNKSVELNSVIEEIKDLY